MFQCWQKLSTYLDKITRRQRSSQPRHPSVYHPACDNMRRAGGFDDSHSAFPLALSVHLFRAPYPSNLCPPPHPRNQSFCSCETNQLRWEFSPVITSVLSGPYQVDGRVLPSDSPRNYSYYQNRTNTLIEILPRPMWNFHNLLWCISIYFLL